MSLRQRGTAVWFLLLIGTVSVCSGLEGDELSGFLDRLVGKPRTTDNNGSVESVSEKFPVRSQAMENWLRNLYDQYVAERASARRVEVSKSTSPSVAPDVAMANKKAAATKEIDDKKSVQTAGKLESAKGSEPGKEVYLDDLTAELDRLLKLLNDQESKRGEDPGYVDKVAENNEKKSVETSSAQDSSVISDDGRVKDERSVSPSSSLRSEASLRGAAETGTPIVEDSKKRSYRRGGDGVDGDRSVDIDSVDQDLDAGAKAKDLFHKPLRELSLEDLYAELKRETMMEKRLLGTKATSAALKGEGDVQVKRDDAVSAKAVGDVDPAKDVAPDAAFYAEKKKELADILSTLMLDHRQNGGKLTNFGRRKKDDPIAVRVDESAIETSRMASPEQKDREATPRSVFEKAYAGALKQQSGVDQNTAHVETGHTSTSSEDRFNDKRDYLPTDVRASVQDVFRDAYAKSLKEADAAVKKIFDDAYNRAMESVASKHGVAKEAKVSNEPKVEAVAEGKPNVAAALASSGSDRKKELIRKFLLDFASELKKESSSTDASQKVDGGGKSQLETVADKRDDVSVAAQTLEELMKGFEVAVDGNHLAGGRP